MILYTDEFQTISFNKNNSLIQMNCTEATSQLLQKNYEKVMLNAVHFVEQTKPVKLLANLQYMIYTGQTKVEPWIDRQVYSKLKDAGLKKLALIKSQDTFTQLVIDQLKERNGYKFETQYFEDEETAKQWLFQS